MALECTATRTLGSPVPAGVSMAGDEDESSVDSDAVVYPGGALGGPTGFTAFKSNQSVAFSSVVEPAAIGSTGWLR